MAGLLANALGTNTLPKINQDEIAQAPSFGYDPERRSIDEAKETVSGQLRSILGSGSPYLDRARTGAMQTANERGLLNSSMAAGAGEAAAIDAALPIASADANIYGLASRDNQAAGNTALQFGAGAANTAGLANMGVQNERAMQELRGTQAERLANVNFGNERALQELRGTQAQQLASQEAQTQKELQTLRGTQATDIENIRAQNQIALQNLRGTQAQDVLEVESEFRNLLQTNASASSMYNSLLVAMTSIATNQNMDTAAKQQSITNMTEWLRGGLGLLGGISGYDLGSLLDFSGAGV